MFSTGNSPYTHFRPSDSYSWEVVKGELWTKLSEQIRDSTTKDDIFRIEDNGSITCIGRYQYGKRSDYTGDGVNFIRVGGSITQDDAKDN